MNERGADWTAILRKRVVDDDLLDFDKIGNKSVRVNASFVVSCTSMMPASSGNNNNVENGAFQVDIYK